MSIFRQGVQCLLSTLLVLGAATAQSDIGMVSIDGEPVPAVLFEGYEQNYKHRLCSPASNDRVREDVVMSVLLIEEGQRQGITIEDEDDYGVKRATELLERLPTDASIETRKRFTWDLQRQLADAYRRSLVGEINDATVLERYRQAIKQDHPKLVNLALLRRTTYELKDASEREAIRLAIAEGATISQLEREGRLGTFDLYQRDDWAPVVGPGYLQPEQAAKLQTGDIVYPERWDSVIVYIHDKKILSRVRPYHPIDGDDWFARRVARHLVYEKRLLELESSLRQAAKVEEDDTVVHASLTYPECAE